MCRQFNSGPRHRLAWPMRPTPSVPHRRSYGRAAGRLLALSVAVLTACSPLFPAASPESSAVAASATPSPTPSPTPRPLTDVRSVGVFGTSVAASGAFSGPGKSQIALLQDPLHDQSVKITVRDANADGETFSETTWLTTAPRSFNLARAKFTVADLTFDGKDDLVALFDQGEHRSKMYVFKSTGSAFEPPEEWWSGDEYLWSRARYVMAGKFAPGDKRRRPRRVPERRLRHADPLLRVERHAVDVRRHAGRHCIRASEGRPLEGAVRCRAVHAHERWATGRRAAPVAEFAHAHGHLRRNPDGLVVTAERLRDGGRRVRPGRASVVAADVTGDFKDDLVSIYGEPDGSAKVHVFDAAATFKPSNSWTGWAALPPASACAGATAVLVGDWNGDRRVDALGLAPTDGVQARSSVLRNLGTSFNVKAGTRRGPVPAVAAHGPAAR